MMKIPSITFMLTLLSMSAFGQNNNSMDNKFIISANGKELTATFADNSSAEAFANLIEEAPLTVSMSDYGNFEKVGDLGHNLPTNDTRITTEPGDVILYLGNNITIYYGVNTWTFTRLGKVDGNPTRESILSVLGNGTVDVTFSKQKTSAGVKSVTDDSARLGIAIRGRRIEVAGNDNSTITVYNIDGATVYSGSNHTVELPTAGIHVVECNGLKAKVLVK